MRDQRSYEKSTRRSEGWHWGEWDVTGVHTLVGDGQVGLQGFLSAKYSRCNDLFWVSMKCYEDRSAYLLLAQHLPCCPLRRYRILCFYYPVPD